MKFAIVEGNKAEATKGAKGTCPSCGSELIARCGPVKINHWGHKGIRDCDPWWEPETEWHRAWKGNFPPEWQEFPFTDEETGEKHRADVHSSHGLVIEFQHSRIDAQERISREKFYKNMVWVVDGTPLKNSYKLLLTGEDYFALIRPGVFRVPFADKCFPPDWLNTPVPVIFDFRGTESIDDPRDMRYYLYCLFPIWFEKEAVIAKIPHKSFINSTKDGSWSSWTSHWMNILSQFKQEWQNQRARQLTGNNSRRVASKYIVDRGQRKKRRHF